MIIGFDGKRAVQNYTGLGNYSRYILEILVKYYPGNEYIIFAPKVRHNDKLDALLRAYPQIRILYPKDIFWKILPAIWRIWRMGQRIHLEKIFKFHGLSNELPLGIKKRHFKKLVTIHDLIFLRFPQYYKFIDRSIYTYKFRKACENADVIIAVSECTKRDIIHFFRIPGEKIEVIYQGCDPTFAVTVSNVRKEEVAKKYNLPPHYILNVGSIEARKNALLIAKALPNLPEDLHLVIIGRRTLYTAQIETFVQTHKLEHRIHILSNIPTTDLPAIYQQADIFAYPSRYEGFGIPIIEALHSGVPVVAATGSCLEEAGGPETIYVDPDDVYAFVKACHLLINDIEQRKNKIKAGKEYVKKFNDKIIAEQLIRTYQ